MDSQTLGQVVRQLRELAASSQDAELVRAFADRRDTVAFAEVVRRHGPMVLGVCRRVLGNSSDADDAFQATFLVLIRKAATLRHADRLAGWLHQVALRTSRKLRAIRASRRGREHQIVDVPAGESTADFIWRELRPIFDEEVSRLPDRLRLPAVLCFLEGCSKAEASRRLGWPEGTLSGRLQRAREWLRARFTARGLGLSSGALAVALFDAVEAAAVSEVLIESTLQQAMFKPAVSAGIRALADGVTQAMLLSKVKAVAASVLVVGAIGTGTGVLLVPGNESDHLVASEPAKSSPPPKDGPKQKSAIEIEKSEDAKANKADIATVWLAEQRKRLSLRIELLQAEIKRDQDLVSKGVRPQDANREKRLREEIASAEEELKNLDDPRSVAEKLILISRLANLKERLSYEERMVKKGFMSEAQLRETKLEVARAESELVEVTAPKTIDSRRAAMDALIQKMEEIVAKTADAVKKGVAPHQELLNAEQRVLEYKFKLIELDGKATPKSKPVVTAHAIDAMKATIQKLEEIVKQTEAGVNRGIIPVAELLNSQSTLYRYQFELAQMIAEARETAPTNRKENATIEAMRATVKLKEAEFARIEELFKHKVVAQEDVRKLRMETSRSRSELATAEGDHALAVQHREAVVSETETFLKEVQSLFAKKVASSEDVRKARVAVADAKIELMRAGVRKQLADLVLIREEELEATKAMYNAKTGSVEELHKAEKALAEAKLRLAEGR